MRAGNSAMISRRRASGSAAHWAISGSVRPQPMHTPRAPSTAHTFTQGLEIGSAMAAS